MCSIHVLDLSTMFDRLVLCSVYVLSIVRIVSLYSILNLNSENGDIVWTLQNKNGSIRTIGSVPGGVYTDLRRAGIIEPMLEGFNDKYTRWVAYDSWSYSASFYVQEESLRRRVINLVLNGVDTIAYIELNSRSIGGTDNMFVRYVFDVKQYLRDGVNKLKIIFDSPVYASKYASEKYFVPPDCVPESYHGECHVNQLRKMQSSFGWDWGPAFPSVGLWKPVFLEFYDGAIIRSVTTNISRRLFNWQLKIKAYLESAKKVEVVSGHLQAVLYVNNNRSIKVSSTINVTTNVEGYAEAEVNMTVNKNVIDLWWPNGYGKQPLYDLYVIFKSKTHQAENPTSIHVRVGFRTLDLIEDDIYIVLGNSSKTDGRTFYFKINGYPLFMKGANWIPSHVLPELTENQDRIDHLLESAKEAHMSMLRVWGGGIYESAYFYQRCDELGLLVWQDFMFANSMYPVDADFISTVKMEIEQNVIRLQHHASIAVWAGNNENGRALVENWYDTFRNFDVYKKDYLQMYVNTIRPLVEKYDPTRRYLISSPSNGRESENETYIEKDPADPRYGDNHNFNCSSDIWDSTYYLRTRFASEYGYQSLPSLMTLRTATNNSIDLHLQSEFSKHRQHDPLGYEGVKKLMSRYVNLKLNESDPKNFEDIIFHSQLSQAMAVKAETEFYRQSQSTWYTMGALYWQLNDVWQAPSWSSIEFGGKWKMLHYFAKSFFAPVLVSPRLFAKGKVYVYLINDGFSAIPHGEIVVDLFKWDALYPIISKSFNASVGPLMAKRQNIDLTSWSYHKNDSIFLRFSLNADEVKSSPYNYIFPVSFKDVQGLRKPNIEISVSSKIDNIPDGKDRYEVEVRADTVVLFLWLETDDLEGKFEDNGFIVTSSSFTVKYYTDTKISPSELQKTITYKYYLN